MQASSQPILLITFQNFRAIPLTSLRRVESISIRTAQRARPTDWRARWYGLRPDAAAMQTFSTSRLIVGGVYFRYHLMPISIRSHGHDTIQTIQYQISDPCRAIR